MRILLCLWILFIGLTSCKKDNVEQNVNLDCKVVNYSHQSTDSTFTIGGKGFPEKSEQIDQTYDINGLVSEKLTTKSLSTQSAPYLQDTKVEYTFDANGFLTKATYKYSQDNSSRITTFSYEKNLLTLRERFRTDGSKVSSETFQYDPQGLLNKQTYTSYSASGRLSNRESYTKTKSRIVYQFGSNLEYTENIDINEQGLPIARADAVNYRQYKYSYAPNGNIQKIEIYVSNTLSDIWEYTFDDKKKPSYPQFKGFPKEISIYPENFSSNNLIKQTSYLKSGGLTIKGYEEQTNFEYNQDNFPIKFKKKVTSYDNKGNLFYRKYTDGAYQYNCK